MQERLYTTPAKLRSAGNEFVTDANRVKNITNQMLAIVRGGSSYWQSSSGNTYRKRFNNLSDDMNKMHKKINKYNENLKEIAQKYDTTEKQNETIASGLAEDVIS